MNGQCLSNKVAIVGAGFSEPAGLPLTGQISEQFLTFKRDEDIGLPRVYTRG